MKKLFEVNNDEIKRILTLHESRTKSQYLDVISEQVGTSPYIKYVTSKQNCFDGSRCVPAGTTFVPFNENVAIAYGVRLNNQESPVNVKFYCKSPDFRFGISFQAGESIVYNERLKSTLLQKVCGHPKNTSSKPTVEPKQVVKKYLDTVTVKPKTQQVVNTKSPQVNRQQQFVQQVKTYNTQIQTSLGVQKPTGQITDADLDNILTKLS